MNNKLIHTSAELPCCRPCQNTGGYLANISLPTTCESPAKDCQKLGARCCRGPRVEGCSCPLGTFFDGKKCVNQTEKCSKPCVATTTVATSSTTSSISSSSSTRYVKRHRFIIAIRLCVWEVVSVCSHNIDSQSPIHLVYWHSTQRI